MNKNLVGARYPVFLNEKKKAPLNWHTTNIAYSKMSLSYPVVHKSSNHPLLQHFLKDLQSLLRNYSIA